MSKRIYVGNLPYAIDDEQLQKLFTDVEGITSVTSAKVIMDKFSGRSKGFGFVELDSDDEAQIAINKLNGLDMNGRALVVNEARPFEARPNRGGGYGQGGQGSGDRQNYSSGRTESSDSQPSADSSQS